MLVYKLVVIFDTLNSILAPTPSLTGISVTHWISMLHNVFAVCTMTLHIMPFTSCVYWVCFYSLNITLFILVHVSALHKATALPL